MTAFKDYVAPQGLLKDRVILVTGASMGLGGDAARAYAKAGATVILLARNEKKLSRVYDSIEADGSPQPAAIPFDLAKATDQDFANLANLIWKEFGRLDGILHSAHAFNQLGPIQNQKLDDWNEMFRVNVAAPFALTKACLPLLKQSPDASVLFTGETHGQAPNAFWGGYSVTKGGLNNLVSIMANEWDNLPNLRLNLLIPGPVFTTFRLKTYPGESRETIAKPEDILPGYLYWMGEASRGQSGMRVELASGTACKI